MEQANNVGADNAEFVLVGSYELVQDAESFFR